MCACVFVRRSRPLCLVKCFAFTWPFSRPAELPIISFWSSCSRWKSSVLLMILVTRREVEFSHTCACFWFEQGGTGEAWRGNGLAATWLADWPLFPPLLSNCCLMGACHYGNWAVCQCVRVFAREWNFLVSLSAQRVGKRGRAIECCKRGKGR